MTNKLKDMKARLIGKPYNNWLEAVQASERISMTRDDTGPMIQKITKELILLTGIVEKFELRIIQLEEAILKLNRSV